MNREYVVNPLAQFRVAQVMHPPLDASGTLRTVLADKDEELAVAYPDELLDEAMTRLILNGSDQIPVVNRNDGSTVIGVIDADAIALAWHDRHAKENIREKGSAE